MRTFLVIAGWAVVSALIYVIGVKVRNWRRSRERLLGGVSERAIPAGSEKTPGMFGLRHWLVISGVRGRGVAQLFIAAAVLCFVGGFLVSVVVRRFGMVDQGLDLVSAIPGAPGDFLRVSVYAAPWVLFAILASLPWVHVRGMRRKRVREIEQDLPISLELLATLGEAGLGFDAALNRLLESQPLDRPLAREFGQFQVEALAGIPRIQCLRRFSRRIEVSSVSIFISALVQAEQVGAGMADVLRRQADDLRNRRREGAMALAQTVPVKLTFPLVICFLPGIFVTTLGPTFYQFFQLAENVMKRSQ
jgi:tight adherence protein C